MVCYNLFFVFSILVNYYSQDFFNLKVILYLEKITQIILTELL